MTFEYPLTEEQQAATVMLGGKLPQNQDSAGHFNRVQRAWGTGDVEGHVGEPTGTTMWPRGGKSKKGTEWDKGRVKAALEAPKERQNVRPVDPRQLHATQPSVTRTGVNYYMGNDYKDTGRTFADHQNTGNAQPVVYRHESGKNFLLSGHHRATAAVLQGEQLNALIVEPPQ